MPSKVSPSLEAMPAEVLSRIFALAWPLIPRSYHLGVLSLSKALYPTLCDTFHTSVLLRFGKPSIPRLARRLERDPDLGRVIKHITIEGAYYGSELDFCGSAAPKAMTMEAADLEQIFGRCVVTSVSVHVNTYDETLWERLSFMHVQHLHIRCDIAEAEATAGRWMKLVVRIAKTLKTLSLEEIGDRSKKGYRLLRSLPDLVFPDLVSLKLRLPDVTWPAKYSNDLIPVIRLLLEKTGDNFQVLDLDQEVSTGLIYACLRARGAGMKRLGNLTPDHLPGREAGSDEDEDEDNEDESGYDSQGGISEEEADRQNSGAGSDSRLVDALQYDERIGTSQTLAMLTPKLEYLHLVQAAKTPYTTLPPSLISMRLLFPNEEVKDILANLLQKDVGTLSNLRILAVETNSEGMEVIHPTKLQLACEQRGIRLTEVFS